MCFSNKVVLVTGGSSGIGAATAVSFAKADADVVIVGRDGTKLNTVAKECAKNGKAPLVIQADLSKEEVVKHVVEETIKKFGKLDVLVNNAGIAVTGTILDGKVLNAYDTIIQINVRAVIQLTTLAAPHLIKTKGNIVNVSSAAGKKIRFPESTAYSVSKTALDQFTLGAAFELSATGVRVNAVSPGPVNTDFFTNCGLSSTADSIGAMTPLKRTSCPEEIADIILFLASEKAKGITGSNFLCDNGILLKI